MRTAKGIDGVMSGDVLIKATVSVSCDLENESLVAIV